MADEFPDRPNHPDFWMLSTVVQTNDDTVEGGADYENVVSRLIDPESLAYMAWGRARIIARAADIRDESALSSLASMFIDGFVAGYAFLQEKQARPATVDEAHRRKEAHGRI